MRFIAVALAATLVISSAPALAQASCIGSSTMRTCTDQYGNTYTTTRTGNSSLTYGSNPRTGSTWNQQSYRTGNITNTYGTDSRGRSWSSTTTPYGTYGTDADGRSFYAPNYSYGQPQQRRSRTTDNDPYDLYEDDPEQ